MGHDVEEDDVVFDGLAAMRSMMDVWFFGFDLRLAGLLATQRPRDRRDTLEPVIHMVYDYACRMKPAQFLGAMARAQHRAAPARRATSRATTSG